MHRNRVKRHGDPHTVKMPKGAKGSAHLNWKGDAAGIGAVHARIVAERGYAREYQCPCGKQATDWAFDQAGGYSTDLSRYTPMCHKCHLQRDLGRKP
jgi:hypothetical protein